MDNTLVSIIMPAYNAAQFIAASIESVIKQSYPYWELIIVDDDSTDDTKNIALSFAARDSRIRYIYQQRGKQGRAKNNGIRHANADLIAFLDADDIWEQEKLAIQLAVLTQQDADLIFSDAAIVNENGLIIKDTFAVSGGSYSGREALKIFFEKNRIPALTVLAKKQSILDAGGFDERNEVQYGEDYSLWIRMLLRGATFISTDDRLGRYRVHTMQSIGNKASIIQVITMLQQTPVTETELVSAKNTAVKQWIKKFLRLNTVIEKADLKQAVAAYPKSSGRSLLQLLQGAGFDLLTRKLLYIFCSI